MFYLLTKFKFQETRENMDIGGEDIDSLMDVDIRTEVILFVIELFFSILFL
jgi:hypothetical protein